MGWRPRYLMLNLVVMDVLQERLVSLALTKTEIRLSYVSTCTIVTARPVSRMLTVLTRFSPTR